MKFFKTSHFIAICMTALLIGKLLEGSFFDSLLSPVLMNWLVLLAFIVSWLQVFGVKYPSKKK